MRSLAWFAFCAAVLGLPLFSAHADDAIPPPPAQARTPGSAANNNDGGSQGPDRRTNASTDNKGSAIRQEDALLPAPRQVSIPPAPGERPAPDVNLNMPPGPARGSGSLTPTQLFVPLSPDEAGPDFIPIAPGPGNYNDSGISINKVNPRLGIYFLRPYWSKRDFSIAVPGGSGAGGVILADTRDVANDYSVAPVVDVTVQFTSLNVTFNGFEYALSSSVDQAVQAGAGTASLTGTSSLTLREATTGEVGIPIDRFVPNCLESWFQNGGETQVGIGGYYLYVDQDYNAILTNGTNNKATLHSHQNFEGFGLVGSLDLKTGPHFFKVPSYSNWYWDVYSRTNGAIVMGTNKRLSDYSVTGGSSPSVHDNATDFIPVGTLEIGFDVAKATQTLLPSLRSPGKTDPVQVDTDVGFSVGAVAQVIGDVGMPSARSGGSRALENGSLFVVGFQATFVLKLGSKVQ
jgi:hypothetical protein